MIITFQSRVNEWVKECFKDNPEQEQLRVRASRFLEEALELVQALGYDRLHVHALVEYVFNRPTGDSVQEVGGTMTTLAALCTAAGIDMAQAGELELQRMWDKINVIREKSLKKVVPS